MVEKRLRRRNVKKAEQGENNDGRWKMVEEETRSVDEEVAIRKERK
jgi:hypothetical protein